MSWEDELDRQKMDRMEWRSECFVPRKRRKKTPKKSEKAKGEEQ
jgi:hypothetical protein